MATEASEPSANVEDEADDVSDLTTETSRPASTSTVPATSAATTPPPVATAVDPPTSAVPAAMEAGLGPDGGSADCDVIGMATYDTAGAEYLCSGGQWIRSGTVDESLADPVEPPLPGEINPETGEPYETATERPDDASGAACRADAVWCPDVPIAGFEDVWPEVMAEATRNNGSFDALIYSEFSVDSDENFGYGVTAQTGSSHRDCIDNDFWDPTEVITSTVSLVDDPNAQVSRCVLGTGLRYLELSWVGGSGAEYTLQFTTSRHTFAADGTAQSLMPGEEYPLEPIVAAVNAWRD